MYAIIGITGHVGHVTATQLLNKNLPVRAILRNPSKGKEWGDIGAEIAIAELNDGEALAYGFKNVEGVFIMTPPLLDSINPIADHDAILDALSYAVIKSKPKKIVYLSSVGAHLATGTGAIKKLYDMEQIFSSINIPSVGIRAAWFMENFSGSIADAKSGKFMSFLNPLDLKIPMVASKDIGLLAAKLLVEDWYGKRIIELEGPCKYSANDVAFVLSNHLSQSVTPEIIPSSQYAEIYQSFGCSVKASEMMAELNNGFNNEHILFEGLGREHAVGETLLEDALKSFIDG